MQITIKNLSYVYSGQVKESILALENVSCRIDSGDFVGIMGHTGCGKSTLAMLIAGLLTPTEGYIYLDGKDINSKNYDRSELRQSIGVVFQYPENQLFETTVEKDIAFGLRYSTLSPGEIVERVKWAAETMGLDFEAIRKQSPMALSGGEKRKVAIAGVLAVKPRVLILDEPVAGLDPYSRKSFLENAVELNNNGMTIIMISHNMDALAEYTRNLLVLDEGKLIESGETKAVFMGLQNGKQKTKPQQVASLISKHQEEFPQDVITYDDLILALKCHLRGGSLE